MAKQAPAKGGVRKAERRGITVALWSGGLIIAALIALQLTGFRAFSFNPQTVDQSQLAKPTGSMTMPDGSDEKFTFLSVQRSNSCGLDAQTVMSYADSKRLQGSCCNAMDMNAYRSQVEGLKAYAEIPGIPSDPYDVAVSDAKEWLASDASITLTGAQQVVYDKAMSMTKDKAPCCCKCWHWYVNRGVAKYAIAKLDMSSDRVAKLINLLSACGGKA